MRIGILGSGLMGSKLGTLFARAGHDVIFSYSWTRQKLEHLAKDAGAHAHVGTPADATRDADAVLLAVHWTRVDDGDSVFWWILWLPTLAAAAWAMRRQGTDTPASTAPNSIPLRVAHGTSALLIVLILSCLASAKPREPAFSHEFNQAMMNSLRKWYRSEVVQPVLVTLMLFQVVSGVILFWRATATRCHSRRDLSTPAQGRANWTRWSVLRTHTRRQYYAFACFFSRSICSR